MRTLRSWLWRLVGLFHKKPRNLEIAAELESHLQLHIDDNLRAGLTPQEARRRAVLALGGVEQTKEAYRDRRGFPVLEALSQDVRFGLRMVRKNPGFTVVVVLTLALGIGANTAVFSMVDSMLLRPLPVKDSTEMIVPYIQQKGNSLRRSFSVPDYRDIENAGASVFSGLTAQRELVDGLSLNGKADRVLDLYVTGNFFSILGIKPALGRLLLESEGERVLADPVIVLGYTYWKTRFGGDPNIIGQKVSVDGQPITVVGVAPEGFYGVNPWGNIQGYLPLGMAPISGVDSNDFITNRRYRLVTVLGRLRPGVSLRQAQSFLSVIAERLSKDHPTEDAGLRLALFPELSSRFGDPRTGTLTLVSGVFLGLASVVFLVSCFNVVNILNAHSRTRRSEIAVRAALGAGRNRLIRQLITEGALLAVGGVIVGIILSSWVCSSARSVNVRTELPLRLDFSFDWRVFIYAFASTLVMGAIVGIAPAIRVSRENLHATLHGAGPGISQKNNRARGALVVAQVAGSMLLLVVAGLFTRSLFGAEHANLGFDPKNVVNFTMDPLLVGYHRAQSIEFFKSLVDRLRVLPGVVSVSTAYSSPMGYITIEDALTISDYQSPVGLPPIVQYNPISPNYFETMHIAMREGRSFTGADDDNASHVAIINEAFARQYWPSQDPIARTFKMAGDPQHIVKVVGVVADVRYRDIVGPVAPYFYIPFLQRPWDDSWETVHIRTTRSPESMIAELQRTLPSFAPGQPVWDVENMNEALYTLPGLLTFQAGAGVAALLGTLGLILTIIGLYGVISYDASTRTHEIGIRMALGAQRRDVLRLVLEQGAKLALIGAVLGLTAALALTRLMRGLLYGISATDPATFAGVAILLVVVALLACYIPTRRAMRVDPLVALRHE